MDGLELNQCFKHTVKKNNKKLVTILKNYYGGGLQERAFQRFCALLRHLRHSGSTVLFFTDSILKFTWNEAKIIGLSRGFPTDGEPAGKKWIRFPFEITYRSWLLSWPIVLNVFSRSHVLHLLSLSTIYFTTSTRILLSIPSSALTSRQLNVVLSSNFTASSYGPLTRFKIASRFCWSSHHHRHTDHCAATNRLGIPKTYTTTVHSSLYSQK